MQQPTVTRRNLLAIAGAGAGLGVLGSIQSVPGDDNTPGARGFTAGSAPAGSNPLAVIDAGAALGRPPVAAGGSAVLDARPFTLLPPSLIAPFDGSDSVVNPESLGKLVCVGIAPDDGAAVVWADWARDDLVAVLGAGSVETGTYLDRPTIVVDETAATALGTDVFAIGGTAAVRAVADVWHGDGGPVADEVLGPLERTPRSAPVRFAVRELAMYGDVSPGRSEAYDDVVDASVWIESNGGESVLGVQYRVDAIDAVDRLASALRSDLIEGSEASSDDVDVPDVTRNDISLERSGDVVTVEYRDADERFVDHVGAVLRGFAAVTGRT